MRKCTHPSTLQPESLNRLSSLWNTNDSADNKDAVDINDGQLRLDDNIDVE